MNPPTVLLIENSPATAKLIVDALARIVPPEAVRICADGAEALDFFRCRGAYLNRNALELPALVLLSLDLPRISGLDVLREIRADPATRLLPVTMLSASDRREDIRLAAGLGANSYVRKSADGRQMTGNIIELARYWLELNVPPPARARQ
ncbi:MAG: two-component system response regulator [Rhodocyclales bacterium GWA2_65_20]|nr:MAG: two-component system response regulator [Rhodocyclales bacterium GWA2_65_20]